MGKQPAAGAIQASRLTSYDEVFSRADMFASDLLRAVPELEAVVIIPTWELEGLPLPSSMIKFRDSNYQMPATKLRLLTQVGACFRELANQLFQTAVGLEQRVRQLDGLLRQRQSDIDTLQGPSNAENTDQQPGTDPAAPAAPGQSGNS